MKRKIFTVIAFLVILFSTSITHAQTANSSFGERVFYYSTSKSNVADVAAHANDIDIIAPQTYEMTAALAASGTVPADLAMTAAADHVKIMPLIANHDFSQTIIHNLLASPSAQNTLIAFLISEAKAKGYIGWQFDFEHINSLDKDAYSAFAEKAATALHADNLILSIAVVAQIPGKASTATTSAFYRNWSGAYDYTRLGTAADFISLMAYDDPDSTGPSAALSYVDNALANALKQIPASKISLGIPLYYWGWSTVPPRRITSSGTYAAAMQRENMYPSFSGFNQNDGVPWIIYRIKQKIYMIWYEDAQSFSPKANLVGQYRLRGFSAWVIGSEDPNIWNILAR